MILSTLSKTSLAIIAASILLVLTQMAESHSWDSCADWKFNKAQKAGSESWAEKDGRCEGYARRFPVTFKSFNGLDSHSPHRHFEQKHSSPESQPACSNGKNGKDKDTYDETLAKPWTAAYQNKDVKGRKFGQYTKKKAGDKVCMRWPAKNHSKDSQDSPVFIGLSKVNPTKDPSQKDFSFQPDGGKPIKAGQTLAYKPGNRAAQRIAALDYGNCSSGSSDAKPCGGCFNLPKNLKPGHYAFQWRWMLNKDEWYTSCGDIEIV